jgi:hypothetical protein
MTALADSPAAWQDRPTYPSPDDTSPGPEAVSDPVLRAERPGVVRERVRTVRSWPLVFLAFPAAAEVWSGWVGIAQKTGFGLVSPLPGIWSSLHLDTTITLPIGVEAYAAYALRAWLATDRWISTRTRRPVAVPRPSGTGPGTARCRGRGTRSEDPRRRVRSQRHRPPV